MKEFASPSSVTIGELIRLVKEFEERVENGTADPDNFLTLSEIEELWGKLIGDTNVLYSDMLTNIINKIDERDLVRKKKRICRQRNQIKNQQAFRKRDINSVWEIEI